MVCVWCVDNYLITTRKYREVVFRHGGAKTPDDPPVEGYQGRRDNLSRDLGKQLTHIVVLAAVFLI
jgi:hypothetical protein